MSDLDAALERLRAVDESAQLDDVNGLPEQLTDALWRWETARPESTDCAAGILICGMGGSAIGGDLARAAFGDRLQRPITVVRGYGLPSWAGADSFVLCSSYSGNTEETVECFRAAAGLGGTLLVATTGGTLGELAREEGVPIIPLPGILQPRAAVAYMFVAAAEATSLSGAGPSLRAEVEQTARALADGRERINELALELATRLEGTVPVMYGAELTVPVAYRWKTQINEYSKLPAFFHALPEADHNEIVGWEGVGGELGAHTAVFLVDAGQHPRNRQRAELTSRLIGDRGHSALTVETQGTSPTERLFWTVMLGDLVSLHLAAMRGVDPAPVAVIEELKDRLGRP